jgi:hypothetical protein
MWHDAGGGMPELRHHQSARCEVLRAMWRAAIDFGGRSDGIRATNAAGSSRANHSRFAGRR